MNWVWAGSASRGLEKGLLAAAATLPLLALIDVRFFGGGPIVLIARLVQAVLVVGYVLLLGRTPDNVCPKARFSVTVLVLLCQAFVVSDTGGIDSIYFDYSIGLPMLVALFFAGDLPSVVFAGLMISIGGSWLSYSEGRPVGPYLAFSLLTGIISVIAALTAMRAKDAEARAQLLRSEDLRQLAAVVAHEMANQSAVLQNTVALFEKRGAAPDVLAIQKEALEQVDTLTRELLTLSRTSELSDETLELAELCRAVARCYDSAVTVSGEDGLRVVGPRDRLSRAVLNLVKNGVEAGGPVEIELARRGRGICLRVSDRGPGFRSEHLAQAGKRFFTTKPHGHGLGLGVVAEVIASLGGSLEVENRSGGGATAILWFPRVAPASTTLSHPDGAPRTSQAVPG